MDTKYIQLKPDPKPIFVNKNKSKNNVKLPPSPQSVWYNKYVSLKKELEELKTTPLTPFDLHSFIEIKEILKKTSEILSLNKKDEIPESELKSIAFLVENSFLNLSELTQNLHKRFYPLEGVEKERKEFLVSTSKDCPVSLMTLRESILKVSRRKNYGPKKYFGTDLNESKGEKYGWCWQMNKQYINKLPQKIISHLKTARNQRLIRHRQYNAYSSAIDSLCESPPNVKNIMKCVDKVVGTNKRAEKLEVNKGEDISKNGRKRKSNSEKKDTKKDIKDAKGKKDKRLKKGEEKKETKKGEIIFDYFTTVKTPKKEKILTSKSKWYNPWQPPENCVFQPLIMKNKIDLKKVLSSGKYCDFNPEISCFKSTYNTEKNPNNIKIKGKDKMKFLLFHENYRPPFFGTFNHKPTAINGRRVFKRVEKVLDYDYDSENDWGEEPEDAEEISSEGEEPKNFEEEELKKKGKIRKDGLMQDDFLVPEEEDDSPSREKQTSSIKKQSKLSKEEQPETILFSKYRKNFNKNSNIDKMYLSFLPMKRKIVEFLPEEEKYLDKMMDKDFCSLQQGEKLYNIIESNYKRRKEKSEIVDESERINQLMLKVEDLTRKMGGAIRSIPS